MTTPVILVSAGIVLCIVLSAFFSGSEMALSACNTVRLENEEKAGKKRASACLRCGACEKACPQRIAIRDALSRAAAAFA